MQLRLFQVPPLTENTDENISELQNLNSFVQSTLDCFLAGMVVDAQLIDTMKYGLLLQVKYLPPSEMPDGREGTLLPALEEAAVLDFPAPEENSPIDTYNRIKQNDNE